MTQHKSQNSGAMRMLNFRVEASKVERFRELAEAEQRTVSQELRHLMDQRIAASEPAVEQAA